LEALTVAVDLVARALAVHDRDGLEGFVEELADLARRSEVAVEHAETPGYIEAVGGWLRDSDGFLANAGLADADVSPWSIVAMALAAGLAYE
jgi:hypothetical protein